MKTKPTNPTQCPAQIRENAYNAVLDSLSNNPHLPRGYNYIRVRNINFVKVSETKTVQITYSNEVKDSQLNHATSYDVTFEFKPFFKSFTNWLNS